MARALRVCKLTLAALEATLEIYLDADRRANDIPTLARLNETPAKMRPRADSFARFLKEQFPTDQINVADHQLSYAGGGSLPAQPFPTVVVTWRPAGSVEEFARRLRTQNPAVVCRIQDDALAFNFRTIRAEDIEPLQQATMNLR